MRGFKAIKGITPVNKSKNISKIRTYIITYTPPQDGAQYAELFKRKVEYP